jgi:hypothetical protein
MCPFNPMIRLLSLLKLLLQISTAENVNFPECEELTIYLIFQLKFMPLHETRFKRFPYRASYLLIPIKFSLTGGAMFKLTAWPVVARQKFKYDACFPEGISRDRTNNISETCKEVETGFKGRGMEYE